MKFITLLIPCYNEESQLEDTFKALPPLLPSAYQYEILFVDDGSKDKTWEMIQAAADRTEGEHYQIRGLRFSRNFGKESALLAGLAEAKGEAVIIMDADLQHPPSHIAQMLEAWEEGYDVVEGVKASRGKESTFSRVSAKLFYKVFKNFSGLQLKNASDFKLLDRKVVDVWKELPEQDPFFRGLSAWVGFKRKSFSFVVEDRVHGESKWTPLKLLSLSLDALLGFTSKPLYLIAGLGIFMEIGFVILAIQTLVMRLSGRAADGFTTVILLQLLIGGSLLLALGLIGIYISKIYDAVKNRPRYLISERTEEK